MFPFKQLSNIMRKATPYMSALVYAFFLTIIAFNATAATKFNWNANNSVLGSNRLDGGVIDSDVAAVDGLVMKESRQRTKSKENSFNNANFNLREAKSETVMQPLRSSLWLMMASLIGGLVARRGIILPAKIVRTSQVNHEEQSC
jgi:hypothetical protein